MRGFGCMERPSILTEEVSSMTAKKNAIAKDLRSPKYRLRVVKSRKAYLRRPKHPRAADAVIGVRSDRLRGPMRLRDQKRSSTIASLLAQSALACSVSRA